MTPRKKEYWLVFTQFTSEFKNAEAVRDIGESLRHEFYRAYSKRPEFLMKSRIFAKSNFEEGMFYCMCSDEKLASTIFNRTTTPYAIRRGICGGDIIYAKSYKEALRHIRRLKRFFRKLLF